MLSDTQKREFVRDGYISVPDAIPRALVNRALRAVNHSIGNVGKGGENPERNRSAFFCAELLQADVILDLYRKSDVMQIAEELLGKGNVLPVESAKPYPRFPDAPGSPTPRLGGHIDGVGSGGNGMAKGTYFPLLHHVRGGVPDGPAGTRSRATSRSGPDRTWSSGIISANTVTRCWPTAHRGPTCRTILSWSRARPAT